MENNFGLGSRDMYKAGQFAVNTAVHSGNLSFSSAATLSNRWAQFISWAKAQNVRKMEGICGELVKEYGRELAWRVTEKEMAAATAQNYVSAVNSVMSIATRGQWNKISPTKDCGISARCYIRTEVPTSLLRDTYEHGLSAVRTATGERGAVIVELGRELGLRSKEASLIDAKTMMKEAKATGRINIIDGTKGGRKREIPIAWQRQLDAIFHAAEVQGNSKSLVPDEQTWAMWRDGGLRDTRQCLQKSTGARGLHDLRAAYACDRYQVLTGHSAPVVGREMVNRDTDYKARQQIAEELGHGRKEVTNCYLGRQGKS